MSQALGPVDDVRVQAGDPAVERLDLYSLKLVLDLLQAL
jgi:hypothetical protein